METWSSVGYPVLDCDGGCLTVEIMRRALAMVIEKRGVLVKDCADCEDFLLRKRSSAISPSIEDLLGI